jgi:hypothetical protein
VYFGYFCNAERSRSMVRWLTDKVTDICLPVVVGDSYIILASLFVERNSQFAE